MSMDITPRIAMEIASHEAIIRQAYKDSVGVWTWSVGLTAATGHDVKRYIGKPQTIEHCLSVYVWALNNYAEAVRAEFKGHDLTEEQFGAALSFHWNTGAIRSASWPDLWKAGKVAEARKSFLSWNKPREIIGRREAEAALFFDGVWASTGDVPEYGVTANGTPAWSTRKLVNVKAALEAMLTPPAPVPAPDVCPSCGGPL
jgi:lysozyme